jgi:hypothetical protein
MTDVMRRVKKMETIIKTDFIKVETPEKVLIHKLSDYNWSGHVKQSVLDAKNVPVKENTKNEVS